VDSLKKNLIKFDTNGQIVKVEGEGKLPQINTNLKIENPNEEDVSSPSTMKTQSILKQKDTPKIVESTPHVISTFFPTPDYKGQPPKFKKKQVVK
jgi:hypothetical protein